MNRLKKNWTEVENGCSISVKEKLLSGAAGRDDVYNPKAPEHFIESNLELCTALTGNEGICFDLKSHASILRNSWKCSVGVWKCNHNENSSKVKMLSELSSSKNHMQVRWVVIYRISISPRCQHSTTYSAHYSLTLGIFYKKWTNSF